MARDNIESPSTPKTYTHAQKIIQAAQRDFKLAEEAENENRKFALEDVKFKVGEQWPMNVRQSREIEQRPCLTVNRIPQFIRQVTNDARHNRPSIKVSPCDSEGDADIAEVINGLFRHIEADSHADIAYDTAIDFSVTMGWGYMRVLTDYVSPDSFDQDIKIKRVKNPFTIYVDPAAIEPDYSDARFYVVVEELPKDVFKQNYPNSELASLQDFVSIGDSDKGWIKENMIRVAEYWVKEMVQSNLYLLDDGTTTDVKPQDKSKIVKQRTAQTPKIKCYKINAVEILEEYDYPGKFIPIIPVLGEDTDVDGRRILSGMVREAQDPQRMLNYWTTAITEAIALAPKAPFIVADGQIEGYEKFWANANMKSFPYLPYKPTGYKDTPLPPPQRQQAEPPVQAMMSSVQMANQQLMDTTGIYQPTLGDDNRDQSGKAILARQSQSNISNFHFLDNFTRSMKFLATVVLDLIPHIYDTERTIRIIGEDGQESTVKINTPDPVQYKTVKKVLSMNTGKYDVVVNTGPNYSTKRQESAAQILEFMRAFPQAVPITGDLLLKNLDWPGADALSKRMKAMLPPAIQQEEAGQTPLPQQAQAHMAQMSQMIEKLTQALHEAQDKIEAKVVESQSRERIQALKSQTDLEIKLLEHHHKGNLSALEAELGVIATNHSAQIQQQMPQQPQQADQ